MYWAGSVKCPNCDSPIDTDTTVCPYCYSSSPQSAPWRSFGGGDWRWISIPIFAGLVLLLAALASDSWFETRWLPRLLEAVVDSQK